MSLTNNMLKNLEQRRLSQPKTEAILDDLQPTFSTPSYLKFVLYFLLVIALTAMIAGIFYANKLSLKKNTMHSSVATVMQPAITLPKSPPQHSHLTQNLLPAPASAMNNPSMPPPPLPSVDNMDENSLPPPSDVLVKTESKESLQSKVDDDYQAALALISQNQLPEAIAKLQTTLDMFPEYQNARLTLATLFLQQNKIPQAQKVLTEGLELQPNNVSLVNLYARSLISENHYDDALKLLLSVRSDDSDYVALLAVVYEHLGRAQDAVALYEKLVAQQPTNGLWLAGLGIALEQTGANNVALENYTKAKATHQLPQDLQDYVVSRIHALNGG